MYPAVLLDVHRCALARRLKGCVPVEAILELEPISGRCLSHAVPAMSGVLGLSCRAACAVVDPELMLKTLREEVEVSSVTWK